MSNQYTENDIGFALAWTLAAMALAPWWALALLARSAAGAWKP